MKLLTAISVATTLPLLAAETTQQGWIADWLIGGPFPSYQVNDRGTGLETDFLDGEEAFRPFPGLQQSALFKADRAKLIAGIGSTNEWGFAEDRTFPVVWKVQHFERPERIELNGFFAPIDDHFVYYAACWIEAPETKKVKFRLGSDDDHKLFVNGKLLGRTATSQDIIPDNFIYAGELKRGINRLLLKVVDRTGGTGFCVALSDDRDQPLTGLRVHTDDPRRKTGADAWVNGFSARFEFASADLFTDSSHALKLHFFPPTAGPYDLRLGDAATRLAGPSTWELTPALKVGENLLKVEVRENGRAVAQLEHTVTIHSRKALQQENAALRRELDEVRNTRKQSAGEFAATAQKIAALRQRLAESRQALEARYAAEHAKAAAKGSASVSDTLPGTDTRARLCINGEWQIGSDRDHIDGTVRLPAPMHNRFFRSWYYPLKNETKDSSGTVAPLPGWGDFHLDERMCNNEVWFARDFVVDDPSQSAFFISENIYGKITLYLNGVECGTYGGRIGIVEIPLQGVRQGVNRLEIHFTAPGKAFGYFVSGKYGLQGDLYVDFCAPVRMADVWVKTSWREAALATENTIENHSGKPVAFRLRQYAVRDGHICFRLPERTGALAAGETVTIANRGLWADPVLWDPAQPNLYELVSDLEVDGKLIDRRRDRFGFREFWIHATDFYLNGKHIILQGDVGHADWNSAKLCDVAWPLYRRDGINTLRIHDSSYWSAEFIRKCDELGMLAYAQMYPVLHRDRPDPKKFTTIDEWLKEPLHQFNLDNYRAWHRMIRNSPAVVIYSTDNEIFTQAWDHLDQVEFNLRNDKLGALYGRFVKSLDPDIVITRDGDIGTWNHQGRWFEDPPCETANYHYPDFNPDVWVKNWQSVYEFRPVIFGETLYCSYGADRWSGALPRVVALKAETVRQIASLYREQEIPGQIYMGLGLDGFIQLNPDGSGSPWQIPAGSPDELKAYAQQAPPRSYPWRPIAWPALSGKGQRPVAASISLSSYGNPALNWFEAGRPSHIRNAVNDAYRDSLLPQPPLAAASDAECLILAAPGDIVWSVAPDGERYGVIADAAGKAYFQFDAPGTRLFTAPGREQNFTVPSRAPYAAKPGFDQIVSFQLSGE